jgi:hypothetical protein
MTKGTFLFILVISVACVDDDKNIFVCLETSPTAVDAQAKSATETPLSVSSIHFMDYNIQQCLSLCLEQENSSYVVRDA